MGSLLRSRGTEGTVLNAELMRPRNNRLSIITESLGLPAAVALAESSDPAHSLFCD